MNQHEKINYIEFPANDIEATKAFFKTAFNWTFRDFGPDYCDFSGQGIDGGFFRSEQSAQVKNGSALIVFFSDDLESTEQKIKKANGTICKEIFEFPGGRRFHFTEPSGNEFGVWSDK